MLRPAVAGTGTSKGEQEWTPTLTSLGPRDAIGVPPEFCSCPAVLCFQESLHEEMWADMAKAVKTLTAVRTPGMLASPFARMTSSVTRVGTGGGGGDDGEPDESTCGETGRDQRSRRSRRSHRCRRPRPSSSDSCSRSDGETVRRVLLDFRILAHKVGDNLLNTLTTWHSYRLDNKNRTFTSAIVGGCAIALLWLLSGALVETQCGAPSKPQPTPWNGRSGVWRHTFSVRMAFPTAKTTRMKLTRPRPKLVYHRNHAMSRTEEGPRPRCAQAR